MVAIDGHREPCQPLFDATLQLDRKLDELFGALIVGPDAARELGRLEELVELDQGRGEVVGDRWRGPKPVRRPEASRRIFELPLGGELYSVREKSPGACGVLRGCLRLRLLPLLRLA